MEAIEGISRGLESIKRKAGTPADKFFQEFLPITAFPNTIRRYLVAAKLLEPVLDDGRFVARITLIAPIGIV